MVLSVNDVINVTNNTTRLALPAALTSAGTGATAARPILVRQQDTKQYWEYNGTTWLDLTPPTPAVVYDATNTVMPAGKRLLVQAFPVATTTISDTFGNSYYDITFPQAFATPPIVMATTSSGTGVAVVLGTTPTTTGVRLFWKAQGVAIIGAHVTAIGWA
jgi:hypothetical protein